jgi:hypothetical protein
VALLRLWASWDKELRIASQTAERQHLVADSTGRLACHASSPLAQVPGTSCHLLGSARPLDLTHQANGKLFLNLQWCQQQQAGSVWQQLTGSAERSWELPGCSEVSTSLLILCSCQLLQLGGQQLEVDHCLTSKISCVQSTFTFSFNHCSSASGSGTSQIDVDLDPLVGTICAHDNSRTGHIVPTWIS